MANENYYDSEFTGEQIDEAIGRILKGEITEYAERAEAAAKTAEEAQTAATGDAERAEDAAERAEATVGKTSYIGDDGYWYEWDEALKAFVNSGVEATALFDINSGNTVKMWFGTIAEYNALTYIDPAVYYNILEG